MAGVYMIFINKELGKEKIYQIFEE